MGNCELSYPLDFDIVFYTKLTIMNRMREHGHKLNFNQWFTIVMKLNFFDVAFFAHFS